MTALLHRAQSGDAAPGLDMAVWGLFAAAPHFSARQVSTPAQRWVVLGGVLAGVIAALLWPHRSVEGIVGLTTASFTLAIIIRIAIVILGRKERPLPPPANDTAWPVYSILVPLYREAAILPQLAAALGAFDYPKDRLDIHLVLEEDDIETRSAAAHYPFGIVAVPPAHPRTKPKACNYAVGFTRGEYLVIYDAEDRPEPDQLKKAVAAFRAHPEVTCFQARLVVDRCHTWMQHMFALDYGVWFNTLLPGLAAARVPIPLGGTSNHFRKRALIEAGLWDPFNVTEDADLGIRLARLGHQVAVLPSATFEEAPRDFSVWLRQRTRWMKGYMQTLLVHGRAPNVLWRELGWRGVAGMQLCLGGAVWSALANPLLWLLFVCTTALATGAPDLLCHAAAASGGTLLLINLMIARFGGQSGAGVQPPLTAVLSYPLFWFLISLACYRALYQLVVDPFRWEKTPHGAAPHSPAQNGQAS